MIARRVGRPLFSGVLVALFLTGIGCGKGPSQTIGSSLTPPEKSKSQPAPTLTDPPTKPVTKKKPSWTPTPGQDLTDAKADFVFSAQEWFDEFKKLGAEGTAKKYKDLVLVLLRRTLCTQFS